MKKKKTYSKSEEDVQQENSNNNTKPQGHSYDNRRKGKENNNEWREKIVTSREAKKNGKIDSPKTHTNANAILFHLKKKNECSRRQFNTGYKERRAFVSAKKKKLQLQLIRKGTGMQMKLRQIHIFRCKSFATGLRHHTDN